LGWKGEMLNTQRYLILTPSSSSHQFEFPQGNPFAFASANLGLQNAYILLVRVGFIVWERCVPRGFLLIQGLNSSYLCPKFASSKQYFLQISRSSKHNLLSSISNHQLSLPNHGSKHQHHTTSQPTTTFKAPLSAAFPAALRASAEAA
jgi:hypothetical protein